MREICTSGSEGGVAQTNAPSLPPIILPRRPAHSGRLGFSFRESFTSLEYQLRNNLSESQLLLNVCEPPAPLSFMPTSADKAASFPLAK